MVDYTHPQRPEERLSDREREDAVRRLASFRDEGRLSAAEFDQRSNAARAAVTRGDLAPFFSDLPVTLSYAQSPPQSDYWGPSRGGRVALGGAVGATIMAIVPFLALGLFFIFGFGFGGWVWAWLFFLLIPLAGIISIYGPGADYRRHR